MIANLTSLRKMHQLDSTQILWDPMAPSHLLKTSCRKNLVKSQIPRLILNSHRWLEVTTKGAAALKSRYRKRPCAEKPSPKTMC